MQRCRSLSHQCDRRAAGATLWASQRLAAAHRPAALQLRQQQHPQHRRLAAAPGAAGSPAQQHQQQQQEELPQAAHARLQAATFSDPAVVDEFLKPLPAEIDQRLADIVSTLPGLGPGSRVIDVGSGTGCLVPHLRARGAEDVLAVDLSAAMLQGLQARHPPPSACGNDAGVRVWAGDFLDLPAYMGPADAVTMNAVFGNFIDPHAALLKAALLLRPGGHVLLGHPMGRAWHARLREQRPDLVPQGLPGEDELRWLAAALPLEVVAFRDEPELYAAVLQVPPGYRFASAPLALESQVVRGFGRGSRQLGVPTANLDPGPLAGALAALPRGVYFGWAQLDAPGGWPAGDGGVHRMVMNVGRRPTVNTGDEAATVEVHVLHSYSGEEFYGATMRVVAAGFIRPEVRFSGLPELLRRIRTDIGVARAQLDEPAAAALRGHQSFRPPAAAA